VLVGNVPSEHCARRWIPRVGQQHTVTPAPCGAAFRVNDPLFRSDCVRA
jgi:hypothetical protein